MKSTFGTYFTPLKGVKVLGTLKAVTMLCPRAIIWNRLGSPIPTLLITNVQPTEERASQDRHT